MKPLRGWGGKKRQEWEKVRGETLEIHNTYNQEDK